MKVTEFWTRMREQFGPSYADFIARDQVIPELAGRTAAQALADGEDIRAIWLAVCEQFDVPVGQRH